MPFSRPEATDAAQVLEDSFRNTNVPDPSFQLVRDSTFIVFNTTHAADILGPDPSYEFKFPATNAIHEAPVYVPSLNSIIYSIADQTEYSQRLLNLTSNPPTITNFTTTPPVLAVNGGKLYQGHIYWAVEGGVPFPAPSADGGPPGPNATIVNQAPGIYRVDPVTRTSEVLFNNYYGTQLNSPNDLWIDSVGDIWFTDSWYGYGINVSSTFPSSRPSSYRFRPSTGEATVVDDTLDQPNGIAFTADESTAFITDTGVTDFSRPPPNGALPRYGINRYAGKNIWAWDLRPSPAGKLLVNKRVLWRAQEYLEDGFHISREGWLLGAAGEGVDVLSQYGEYVMRIYTNFTVNNLQFAGKDRDELWLFGQGGIAKVKTGLRGILQE